MLFLIVLVALYLFISATVAVALFDQDKSLLGLLFLLLFSLLWPLSLLAMSVYKFTRFVNKLS